MAVFLDSSAIYALLNEADANHTAAEATWRSLRTTVEELFTTNYILLESIALLQKRIGIRAVRALETLIVPLPSVLWVGEELHHRAVAALLTAGRRDLSLVDCVSFEVMREIGLDTAFAFDAHFAEQGFHLL